MSRFVIDNPAPIRGKNATAPICRTDNRDASHMLRSNRRKLFHRHVGLLAAVAVVTIVAVVIGSQAVAQQRRDNPWVPFGQNSYYSSSGENHGSSGDETTTLRRSWSTAQGSATYREGRWTPPANAKPLQTLEEAQRLAESKRRTTTFGNRLSPGSTWQPPSRYFARDGRAVAVSPGTMALASSVPNLPVRRESARPAPKTPTPKMFRNPWVPGWSPRSETAIAKPAVEPVVADRVRPVARLLPPVVRNHSEPRGVSRNETFYPAQARRLNNDSRGDSQTVRRLAPPPARPPLPTEIRGPVPRAPLPATSATLPAPPLPDEGFRR